MSTKQAAKALWKLIQNEGTLFQSRTVSDRDLITIEKAIKQAERMLFAGLSARQSKVSPEPRNERMAYAELMKGAV